MKVPSEWSYKRLEDVVSKSKYSIVDGPFGSNLKSEHYRCSGVPVLQSGFVTSGKFIANKYFYVDQKLFEQQKRSAAKGGDLLMAKIGAQAGRCAIIPEDHEDGIIAGNCLKLSFDHNDTKFYYYVLSFRYERDGLSDIKTETAQPAISLKSLKSYKVPVPPLPEQKKIAQILSTWDNAISATVRLLENSQQRKKALMQQLLTGKKRLPGFEGEWRLKTLNDLYSFKRGKGLSKDLVIPNGKNKCVLYGELYTKYGEVISSVISKTDSHDGLLSIAGDVLLPSSTTTTGIDLANATAVLEDEVLLGGDIIVLRPKELLDPIFMSHLLTHVKKHEIAVKAQGITIIHLYGSDLKKIAVNIPENYDEQKAIVKVLTTAYQENELLQKRLDHLRLEKKALMQQLLTGKRRVVVDTDAA
ncbi:TPA: restriction endonuclease subunit S [Morganella morganii]